MKLHLAYYGNPILRKKGDKITEITPELRQLVADMEETMIAHNGIGLAAPQVHRSLALFIVNVPPETEENEPPITVETKVFINPKILEYSKEQWVRGEGCLSIPGVYSPVIRPCTITVEATDLDGNLFTEEFTGLKARAIMHENDHINGKLFIDRLSSKERDHLEPLLREIKKKFGSVR